MFLWLTSPAPATYGGGGGRIFNSPAFYDVSPPDANGNRTYIPHTPGVIRNFNVRVAQLGPNRLPIIKDKRGRLFEVEQPIMAPSGKQLILNRSRRATEIQSVSIGRDRKAIFRDQANKIIASPKPNIRALLDKNKVVQKFVINKVAIFVDIFGNVIDTEEGQAGGGEALVAQNGSLIYYTTSVNDVYAFFQTGTKNGAITPTPTKFPTTQTDLNKITAYAATKGKTFPDPEALAIEVKSSWIEATGLPNLSSYITMQATIPSYDQSDPNHWVPNGQKTVQLALLGMHVVGSTKGHPEMIWATFEHFGNTPNAAYSYNATSGTNPKNVPQNTTGTWLFSANGASAPFNIAHLQASGADLNSISPFTISASNTLRENAWGDAPGTGSASKNTEVISLNNSVLGKLVNGDVRKNYMFIGSTWTIGGAPPSATNQVGTNHMTNTTMETYQQGGNCFDCHATNTTSVSHVFGPLKPLFPGPPPVSIYTSKIQPIFDAKCIACHSGGSPPQGLNLSSGTSFGMLVNINSNELPSMKRIKPNDVPNSYLVHKVEGTQGSVGGSGSKMPLGCSGSSCLTSTQINDIKAWINAGAPPP
jgi:mono/diheme cytochrome c family protein